MTLFKEDAELVEKIKRIKDIQDFCSEVEKGMQVLCEFLYGFYDQNAPQTIISLKKILDAKLNSARAALCELRGE